MKKAIITGATGMVGGIILRECLASDQIEKVTSISRKYSGMEHEKLEEVIHQDFLDYTAVESHFKGQDIGFFCIGVYAGQVPDDKFKMITVDFAKSFADALKVNSPEARCCFLSGSGADLKEKSFVPFARYKGMAENYLMRTKFGGGLHIFRPAYIYPVTERAEPNFTYRLSRKLYPFLKKVYPNGVVTSEHLAKSMFKVGLEGHGKEILENVDIKKVELG